MCSPAVIRFARVALEESDVRGRSVLEIGSLDVNGSVRPVVESLHPASYTGVDIQTGPGVDIVCDATKVLDRFGKESFDVVISTEVLEHVREWRTVVRNFKLAVKPNGVLLVTTRSVGVDFHRHPFDFWRFDTADFDVIFSDLYSILRQKRIADVRPQDLLLFHLRYRLVRLFLDCLPRSRRRVVRERLLR